MESRPCGEAPWDGLLGRLTVDLAGLPPLPPGRPLPACTEPPALPRVPADALRTDDGVLVPVRGPRLRAVPAYWFAGVPTARPWVLVRPPVLVALISAARHLPSGYGLAVLDGWRSLATQTALYEAAYGPGSTLAPGFVSVPDPDPAAPPPHATGGTVDVTLTFTGRPLALGTTFDAFTPAARSDAFESSPGPVREHRRLLSHVLTGAGFVPYPLEWWHFEYGTPRWAAALGHRPGWGAVDPPGAVRGDREPRGRG